MALKGVMGYICFMRILESLAFDNTLQSIKVAILITSLAIQGNNLLCSWMLEAMPNVPLPCTL